MKYIPVLAICALTFLPTPVEGQLFFLLYFRLSNFFSRIFYPVSRDEKDCDVLKEIAGLTNTEACICFGNVKFGVSISCDPMKEKICMTPSDDLFCTNATMDGSLAITATSTTYTADSTARKRFSLLSPPVRVERETLFGTFAELAVPEFRNGYFFSFDRGDGAPSTKKYTACVVRSGSVLADEDFVVEDCNSCVICDSGDDFKYDCSNTKGTYIYSNMTNTTDLIPGPKVETCFPVADIFPLF
jgi:hypothetical protein